MKKMFTIVLIAVFIAAALFILPAPFCRSEGGEEQTQSFLLNGIKELFER